MSELLCAAFCVQLELLPVSLQPWGQPGKSPLRTSLQMNISSALMYSSCTGCGIGISPSSWAVSA